MIREEIDAHRAEAWDEAIDEAEGCGWLHDYAAREMYARNPYRREDQK